MNAAIRRFNKRRIAAAADKDGDGEEEMKKKKRMKKKKKVKKKKNNISTQGARAYKDQAIGSPCVRCQGDSLTSSSSVFFSGAFSGKTSSPETCVLTRSLPRGNPIIF
ncbi:hypothetical protein ElyMa_003111800 [Elysia marginata]|uniref:Uncharacterized protein n=1 Tax=Elysia marginata TaxID=1093978 RepID=A0AAV4IR83_9GAST|nr:hypothetical protein ElyMa_003111800 [Elysia marginata]